jgi:hypothetical protein
VRVFHQSTAVLAVLGAVALITVAAAVHTAVQRRRGRAALRPWEIDVFGDPLVSITSESAPSRHQADLRGRCQHAVGAATTPENAVPTATHRSTP